jgi:hypothetical protein
VANIPLVLELEPPRSLSSVDSRRVFCLTLQPEFLQKFRVSRFSSGERKQKNASNGSSFSAGGFRGLYGKSKKMVYSESEYVERDLQHGELTVGISSLLSKLSTNVSWAFLLTNHSVLLSTFFLYSTVSCKREWLHGDWCDRTGHRGNCKYDSFEIEGTVPWSVYYVVKKRSPKLLKKLHSCKVINRLFYTYC